MNDVAETLPVPEMRFDNAVAFYGTLRPGESNHWLVRKVPGVWIDGIIRGFVFEITWGHYEGHVGFVADPNGHRTPVSVLVSNEWPSHVHKVDEFEGDGYQRRVVTIFGPNGDDVLGQAAVYEFLTDQD